MCARELRLLQAKRKKNGLIRRKCEVASESNTTTLQKSEVQRNKKVFLVSAKKQNARLLIASVRQKDWFAGETVAVFLVQISN